MQSCIYALFGVKQNDPVMRKKIILMEGDSLLKLCTVIQLIHRFKNILNFYYKKMIKITFMEIHLGYIRVWMKILRWKKQLYLLIKYPN